MAILSTYVIEQRYAPGILVVAGAAVTAASIVIGDMVGGAKYQIY